MTSKDIGPLNWNVPIVMPDGRPTPEFQRRWQTQRTNNAQIGTISFGAGPPPATPAPDDGAEYANTATNPYTLYVGKGGVWNLAGSSGANPTATAKDTAVNGTATTFMRSDAAPAIQKATSSQFGIVQVDGTTITSAGGVISSVGGGGGGGWTFQTTSITAASGAMLICTGASSQTITLPAAPTTGAFVAIRVELLGLFSNAVTISGNGNGITGILFNNQSSIRLGLDGQEVWFVYDGTVWRATSPQGPVLLTPKVADFTWTNQGTATAADTATGLMMHDPNAGVPSQRILQKAVSGTFTQLTCLVRKSGAQGNWTNNGPVILNSAGKYIILFEQTPVAWWVGLFNSPTSNSSFLVNGAQKLGATPWWKFSLVSGTLQFSPSEDPANFNPVSTQALSSFLTTVDDVGIAVDGGSAGNGTATFPHFHQE